MKKLLVLMLSVMMLCGLSITANAQTTKIGTTIVGDSTQVNPYWLGKSFTIKAGTKSWSTPIEGLRNTKIEIYLEDGVKKCRFVEIDWMDQFMDQVQTQLVAESSANTGLASGQRYVFNSAFEGWALSVLESKLMSADSIADVNITLNENTCNIVPVADAQKIAESRKSSEYVLAGTCSTSLKGSSADRIGNVTVAAANMNGTVLAYGEAASADALFKVRCTENGYKPAGTYFDGKVVMGIGGGICQASSTLYNALMNAGVQVTMRYNHSSPVHYLPLGLDAAIATGVKDLRFVNNYAHPIRLEAFVEGKTVTVNVYVHNRDLNGRTYKFWSKATSSMSAVSYLTTYVDGQEVSTVQVASSKYVPLKTEEEN